MINNTYLKTISILVPCYNERENIRNMSDAITEVMQRYEGKYAYEIVFRDNSSTDDSVNILKEIARNDSRIKVIVNARNYGFDALKDTFIGRISGDAIISIACDFQDPPDKIPEFISAWEEGYEAACGIKDSSKEGCIKYGLRQVFYKIIAAFSDIPQYNNMSGIFLVSRRLWDMKADAGSGYPWRYFLADVGCQVKLIHYEQEKRAGGKSSYNTWRYFSFAIDSMINTSTVPLRIATVSGIVMSVASFIVGLSYLVFKLVYWDRFVAGIAPIMIGIFFLGSVILAFLGIVGEYVGNILGKVTPQNPPLIRELINFEQFDDDRYLIREVTKEHEGKV